METDLFFLSDHGVREAREGVVVGGMQPAGTATDVRQMF